MRYLIIIMICLCCQGCASGLLDKLPNNEFKSFKYFRGGNVTSASIEATNGKKTGETLTIESLKINESWPGFTMTMEVEGYTREVSE